MDPMLLFTTADSSVSITIFSLLSERDACIVILSGDFVLLVIECQNML